VIKINNASSKLNECRDKLPPQIFDGNKISEKKIMEHNLVDAVEGVCDDVIKVTHNESNFMLTVESFGQLSIKDIMKKACEVLKAQSDELLKEL